MKALVPVLAITAVNLTAKGQQAECPPVDTVEVVQVHEVGAVDLFERCKRWFATSFNDNKEVIKLEDPSTYTIIGKGSTSLNEWSAMLYTIEIACKDGRYRVELRDIEHEGIGGRTSLGTYYPNPSYGKFYRCSVCCDGYREYLSTNAGKDGFNPNVCIRIPIEIRKAMTSVLASLNSGMNKAIVKDW